MTTQKIAPTSKKTVSSTRTANVGLATVVKELSAHLDAAEAQLGPEAPSLTGTEKRRAVKPRKGAERILAAIAPIVQQHGLESSSLSAAEMTSRQEHAQTLQPLQSRLQKLKKRVDDEVFTAHGDAWGMGLQFYSLLKSRAKGDGELATSLEPVTKMFAYRHPSVKAEKPSKVQTRAKKKLKSALALAERHDVPLGKAGGAAANAAAISATGAATTAALVVTVPQPVQPAATTAQGQASAAPAAVVPSAATVAAPVPTPPATSPAVGAGAAGGLSVTVNHS
jgi:hypothetical protein